MDRVREVPGKVRCLRGVRTMTAPAWIRAVVDLPLRLVAGLVDLVGQLVSAKVREVMLENDDLVEENLRFRADGRALIRAACDLRVRLKAAIEDRDRFLEAWRRCRSGEPAFDPGPPLPITWEGPYGPERDDLPLPIKDDE